VQHIVQQGQPRPLQDQLVAGHWPQECEVQEQEEQEQPQECEVQEQEEQEQVAQTQEEQRATPICC